LAYISPQNFQDYPESRYFQRKEVEFCRLHSSKKGEKAQEKENVKKLKRSVGEEIRRKASKEL